MKAWLRGLDDTDIREEKTGVRKENAFITLEAALLMGVILPTLIALLIAGFYVHDKALLQAGAKELTALAGCMRLEDTKDARLEKELENMRSGRLVWGRSLQGHISAGEESAEASISGSFPVPGLIMRILSGGKLKLAAESSRKIWHPAGLIWKIRGVIELTDSIRGREP